MRFKRYLVPLLLSSCLIQHVWADDAMSASKNAVQAAFLYNFALFTEWPKTSAHHINVCVMDSAQVFEALQPFTAKQVRGHPMVVTHITSATQALSCQILFVGQSGHASIRNLARQIGKAPVLVVAEEGSFDQHDVAIVLVPQQGRIGFKINNTSAQTSSMIISSKLLKLAQQVY